MPLYMKPGLRAKVWLDTDENDNPRPTFFAKALDGHQQIELSELIDNVHESTNGRPLETPELFSRAEELLGRYVDGWENMQEPFSLDLLAYGERMELLRKICFRQGLEYEEKKT